MYIFKSTFFCLVIGLITGLGISLFIALVIITKSPFFFTQTFLCKKQHSEKLFTKKIISSDQLFFSTKNSSKLIMDILNLTPKITETQKQSAIKFQVQSFFIYKWHYFLQIATFHNKIDAEKEQVKLSLLNFKTKIHEKLFESGILYRVRIGPFTQIKTFNKIRNKLINNNINVVIVRILQK